MAAASGENATSEKTTSYGNTTKIPATEICILIVVYIVPFLNRLNLLSQFQVLEYAMSPIMPLLGFYRSIPTLGLIVFLALFIGFVRYRNSTKFNYSLVMDCVVIVASLVRPFLVNPVPLAAGALGFRARLLNVLELLGFQTCIHSCLEYLSAAQQWVGEENTVNEEEEEKVSEEEGEKVNEASVVSGPFIDTLARIMEVVLKTYGDEGRHEGKSSVSKLIKENNDLLTDVNSSEYFNKYISFTCRSCLNSLLNLLKKAVESRENVATDIAREADNLLWLLDILADRQAAEEFALMWANHQELPNLHMKYCCYTTSRHLISFITTRLIVGIGNGQILASKETQQILLLKWFQPLSKDYSCLRELNSFHPRAVEENIGRIILELPPKTQQSFLLAWYECFLKKPNACPDLRKAFDAWSRRSAGKTPLFK